MRTFLHTLGVIPYLLFGLGLVVLGLLSLNHLLDNIWLFDTTRLDIVRLVAQGQANPQILLEAAYVEVIVAFLGGISIITVGLSLPLVYFLNYRFMPHHTNFFVIFRQAMWMGFWVAFCVWLQMNRTLGIAIILLVAAVFVLFEILLQIRTRSTAIPNTPPAAPIPTPTPTPEPIKHE